MDAVAIMAALLHDTIEDTGVTKEELAQRFGKPVAELVEGLSKLDRLEFASWHKAPMKKISADVAGDGTGYQYHSDPAHRPPAQHADSSAPASRPDKRRRIARETLEATRRLPIDLV